MSKKKEDQQSTSVVPQRTVVFERFHRGTEEVDNHLVKLKVANMKRNISWVWRAPQIVDIEHVHFWHSVNDTTLQPNKYSQSVGGHFHEVTLELDEEGQIVGAKCGPALQYVSRKISGGRTIRRVERVKWERYNESAEPEVDDSGVVIEQVGDGSNSAQVLTDYDNHTHELEYKGFERISANSKIELRKQETAKVKGLMSGPVSRQPGAMQKLTNQQGSDVARKVLVEGAESTKG